MLKMLKIEDFKPEEGELLGSRGKVCICPKCEEKFVLSEGCILVNCPSCFEPVDPGVEVPKG